MASVDRVALVVDSVEALAVRAGPVVPADLVVDSVEALAVRAGPVVLRAAAFGAPVVMAFSPPEDAPVVMAFGPREDVLMVREFAPIRAPMVSLGRRAREKIARASGGRKAMELPKQLTERHS